MRFEDGTLNYLDIPAVKIGLDYIENIGIQRINETCSFTQKIFIRKFRKFTTR